MSYRIQLEPWQDRHVTARDLPLPSLALPYGEHVSDRHDMDIVAI
jgi:hypothetical protein